MIAAARVRHDLERVFQHQRNRTQPDATAASVKQHFDGCRAPQLFERLGIKIKRTKRTQSNSGHFLYRSPKLPAVKNLKFFGVDRVCRT